MNSTGRTYNRNDLVTLDSLFQRPGDAGKVWKVTKAPTARNQVNYLIEPVNGGVGLRVKGYMLQPATEAEQAAAKAIAATVPQLEPLHAGQVVTVTDHPKDHPDGPLRRARPEGRRQGHDRQAGRGGRPVLALDSPHAADRRPRLTLPRPGCPSPGGRADPV
jgi:hypothetical protein